MYIDTYTHVYVFPVMANEQNTTLIHDLPRKHWLDLQKNNVSPRENQTYLTEHLPWYWFLVLNVDVPDGNQDAADN